jgi:hypothetical protein
LCSATLAAEESTRLQRQTQLSPWKNFIDQKEQATQCNANNASMLASKISKATFSSSIYDFLDLAIQA